jgi:hypothetical protein
MEEGHTSFMGTYFNKDTALKIARLAKIGAWIVLGIYSLHLILAIGLNLSQIFTGLWVGMRFTDVIQSFLSVFEQVLPGGFYFIILMGVAQLILIVLDVEDNTRRAARR